jgi:hypothetical protein
MYKAKRNTWDGPVPKEPRIYAREDRFGTPRPSLPTGHVSWYHLLNGERHVIDLVTQWDGDGARLRRKAYYEAYSRLLKVKTEQTSYRTMAITAFNPWPPGSKYYTLAQDQLERAGQQVPEPDSEPNPYNVRLNPDEVYAPCTCGSVGQFHTASCAAVTGS